MDGQTETKVAECEYRKSDRLLMEHFIGGLNDDNMTEEILKEVTMLENIEETTGESMLGLTH